MKDYPMNLGVLPDDRTEEKKLLDWKAREVAFAPKLEWKELDIKNIKVLFTKNQKTSSSCVAQTTATIISRNQYREEGNEVNTSATPIYQQRVNLPELGMREDDIRRIITKKGTTLEVLMPSNEMTDGEMNEYPRSKLDDQIGQILRSKALFRIDQDIDSIAGIMEAYRTRSMATPVMLWFRFPRDGEWWKNVPVEGNGSGEITGHSVCGLEYGLYKGEKAIAIQESAGMSTVINPGKQNIRIITKSYLDKHIYLAAWATDLKNDWRDTTPPADSKPVHYFSIPLNWSDAYIVNPEVKILQDILKYEGFFATDKESTGYYGSYTASCVLAFQIKHGVDPANNMGRRVGPQTLKVINEIYGK